MKKLNALLTLSAALAMGSFVSAAPIVIGDFTIPPATAGQLASSFTNLDNNVVNTWRINPSSASGIGAIVDEGAGDGFLLMARNFSNNLGNKVVLGIMLKVSDYGLTANTNYSLKFDYMVDRVGSRAYDANANIQYAVASLTTGYNQVNGSTSSTSISLQNPTGAILVNYSDVTNIVTPGQTAWTTHTSSINFSFATGTEHLAILIQGAGYGVGNNTWPANGEYTYLGIDNVTIIPEPGTLAFAAIALGTFVLFLRRKKK